MSDTARLASDVITRFAERGLTIATAESCTGGLIAAALTDVAGSSRVFERGFVTYSNAAKIAMLGVGAGTLEAHGAVSAETALAMALGALDSSPADVAVSVTGIAGPGGGSLEKPVGLVHLALAIRHADHRHETMRLGEIGRAAIRTASVEKALTMLLAVAYPDDARE